ncbi:MAG: glycosyltransferase, partial [Verrucomicrobia bacterium]|nr:glycosyltransferase [Verrucomicrobiota bacterium]
DNSPNAVKEAVAAGVPVVASAIGGIVDYVIPGENGFLFPAGNVEGCRGAIRSALGHETLGKGHVPSDALGRLRDYLSPATMCRKFLEAYRIAASAPHR